MSRIAGGVFSSVHRDTRAAIFAYRAGGSDAFVTRFEELADDADWSDLADLVADLAGAIADRQAQWRTGAACRHPGITVDIFYVGRGEDTEQAKAICARCPVTNHCTTYADQHHEQIGVWGGLAPKERRPSRRIDVA